jgi:hypothetical protein
MTQVSRRMTVWPRQKRVPMPLVTLDLRIIHLATNQTFGVKDSVFWVGVEGALGGISNTETMNESSETYSTAN